MLKAAICRIKQLMKNNICGEKTGTVQTVPTVPTAAPLSMQDPSTQLQPSGRGWAPHLTQPVSLKKRSLFYVVESLASPPTDCSYDRKRIPMCVKT